MATSDKAEQQIEKIRREQERQNVEIKKIEKEKNDQRKRIEESTVPTRDEDRRPITPPKKGNR